MAFFCGVVAQPVLQDHCKETIGHEPGRIAEDPPTHRIRFTSFTLRAAECEEGKILKIKEHNIMLQIVELKLDLKKLQTQIDEIVLDDAGEKRSDVSSAEYKRVQKYLDKQDEIVEMIETLERTEESRNELSKPVEQPVTNMVDGTYTGGGDFIPAKALKDNEPRNFRNVFNPKKLRSSGNLATENWKSFSEFLTVIGKRGYDPRLEVAQKRAMTEGIPHDGGYAVPEYWSEILWDPVIENSVVLSRAHVIPMKSNVQHVPAFGIGSHSIDIFDGFIAYWSGETSTLSETTPKMRSVDFDAKKLSIYTTLSNELLMDMPGADATITKAMSQALEWYLDYYLLNGVGGGEPLGLINSAAIVSVAKETGQTADTIVYDNLAKMFSRMLPGCRQKAVWVCNANCIPQLLKMSVPIGTSGSFYPVLNDKGGTFSIFSRPVVITEKLPQLGDANDIVFADLSQYAVGLRKDIWVDKSEHFLFSTDKTAFRAQVRVDAHLLQDESLTPKKATSDTLSSVVGLAERA